MAAPRYEITQKLVQNPHASGPLIIPIVVICNTPEEVLTKNVRENSSLDLPWLQADQPHKRVAVMIGGGPSANDHVQDIIKLQEDGAVVFAMNGASRWARERGIRVDYQVMSDAKPETSTLVDEGADAHLFASQVDPTTIDRLLQVGIKPTLWHLEIGDVEDNFREIWRARPAELRRGGYALIGGGATTGNCAVCIGFAKGHREFHIFGYDSSHSGNESHAYRQAMNDLIPTVEVEWAGRTFTCSVAMKAQAEKFQITAQALKEAGCDLKVYGYGLLPQIYNSPPTNLSERDKYRTIWQFDEYRNIAPGEFCVQDIMGFMGAPGPVIDFGCGTGRTGLRLSGAGYEVILVDFADNCRDDEALRLPFVEWDLTRPCPLRAPYGVCTDVMEHIPTSDVDVVVQNIMGSASRVYFQISTVADQMGSFIHDTLHLTVRPHGWWRGVFERLGFEVEWERRGEIASSFLVKKEIAA